MAHIIEIHENKTKNHEYQLFAPEQLMKQWHRQAGDSITVQFGTAEIECTVSCKQDLGENQCQLSSAAWNALSLPFPVSMKMEYDGAAKLYGGPLIGIFTAGFTGSILRPVGERSFLFAKYIHAAKAAGTFAVLFGSHHIQWEEGCICGYTFTGSGWEKITVPLPNVIYDRLPNRKTEAHPTYSGVKKRLQEEYKIPWFNPGFFDKSLIYQQLANISDVNHFLPQTIIHPEMAEIKDFIHEHEHVYIKPKNGSLGFGIQQIIFEKNENYFYCRFRDQKRNRLRRYGSLTRLLKRQFPAGFQNLIVQQGISLLKYQNKPIDFRVHTNKDEHGKWRLSAVAAKIAGPGSVTTHVKSGGNIKTIHEILEDLRLNKSLLEDLKNASLTLSKAIDETTAGYVGEIGFDLGIDEANRIWMFEANSKPGRTIFSHPKLKREDQLTMKLPMDYASYLYHSARDGDLLTAGL
ncbi:YheC/D like ATP-grasp [Evansella caseinilytica]|uniref:YheC/D like ATP-grasp n=1 Tax=Evansella caseinilytica TaxID=1503961 RepID=A0A1H3K026_9BACI|nr:YheC/YheD family protein [Evansella caseinilytica]SDY45199.1 YheC/D like ATP-grasp [Evansella caseinilytica]